jgi:hypothetical protein
MLYVIKLNNHWRLEKAKKVKEKAVQRKVPTDFDNVQQFFSKSYNCNHPFYAIRIAVIERNTPIDEYPEADLAVNLRFFVLQSTTPSQEFNLKFHKILLRFMECRYVEMGILGILEKPKTSMHCGFLGMRSLLLQIWSILVLCTIHITILGRVHSGVSMTTHSHRP